MRVILTGASGFIGRYVLDSIRKREIEVIAIGRTKPDKDVPFIRIDLINFREYLSLFQQVKPTHLIHLAWYVEHGKFWNSPMNLRWLEVTVRLVEAFCLSGGRNVVIAGTYAEYDWSHGYCLEDRTPLNPTTFYGTVKDATRRLVMAICDQYRVACAWARIFLPFGIGESHGRLIPSLIQVFHGKRAPFGVNSNVYRDFVYAPDVGEAFFTLLKTGAKGVYNVCTSEPTRLSEVVNTIASFIGADPTSVLTLPSERPGEPPFIVGDNQKLKALGWEPSSSFTQNLMRYLEEWSSHVEAFDRPS